jgi:hypothetical protein
LPITSATRGPVWLLVAGGGAGTAVDAAVCCGSVGGVDVAVCGGCGAVAAASDNSDRRTFAVAWLALLLASAATPSSVA